MATGASDAFSCLGLYQARMEVFCRFELHEETMVQLGLSVIESRLWHYRLGHASDITQTSCHLAVSQGHTLSGQKYARCRTL